MTLSTNLIYGSEFFNMSSNNLEYYKVKFDHSTFHHHSLRGCIFLIVNVNVIVIKGSVQGAYFPSKTIVCSIVPEQLWYLLCSKVAQSKVGLVMSQRKYALDI